MFCVSLLHLVSWLPSGLFFSKSLWLKLSAFIVLVRLSPLPSSLSPEWLDLKNLKLIKNKLYLHVTFVCMYKKKKQARKKHRKNQGKNIPTLSY